MTIYKKLLAMSATETSAQIVTLISAPPSLSSQVGQAMIIYPDGTMEGILADEAVTGQVADYVKRVKWDKPGIFQLSRDNEYVFFRDRYSQARSAIIFGGGHISQPLAEMLALLDFAVTVIDDRPEFANKARFPRAQKVICEDFSTVLASGKLTVDAGTAVIIVTRGHSHDLDCLRGTINSDAGYIGMIGSKRRVKGILEMLSGEGVARKKLQKLHAPIGLDLGAVTPAEIALCIAAEIVAVYNSGSLGSLSLLKRGDRHGQSSA